MEKQDYWKKQERALFSELEWNIPEQKQGRVAIVGGNAQNFSLVSRMVGVAGASFPFSEVRAVMPDALRGKIPSSTPGIDFVPSTEGGSLAKSVELNNAMLNADATLIIGDLTKNAQTGIALAEAIKKSENMIIIARDAVDLLSPEMANFFDKNLIVIGSMAQIQKMFRLMYYPKVLLLSMPLMQVTEVLHKFTLSYPFTIVTLHQDMVVVAHAGEVVTTRLSLTGESPLSIWGGKMAVKIMGWNLYNPGKRLEATAGAVIG